jgi:hypothetical protein
MSKLELPENPKLASQVLSTHADQEALKLRRGIMGWLFGMGEEKQINVGAFAFIFSSLMFIAVYLWGPDGTDFPKGQVTTVFGGLMSAALGYVFGQQNK